jgi:mono/diheme cytochrome c family protein
MLEFAGLTVNFQLLDEDAYHRMTNITGGKPSPEQQGWDIALRSFSDYRNVPALLIYHDFALDGPYDWVDERPVLRQLYERALHTVNVEQQRDLIRQMEKHTYEQAYFLFLYHPVQLYAVNQAVAFTPSITSLLTLAETSVTDAHWSVREGTPSKTPAQVPRRPVDPTNAEQVAVGQRVYQKHCATCHGANLEGQPNWRQRLPSGHFPAPPHDQTGHTWHHPDQYLFETTKYGWQRFAPPGYQSTMLGFQEVLSDAEIWAVLAFIKSRWPPSIQEQQERLNTRHR